MKKLIAGMCVISLSACSASGMSLGLGAGVTVAGSALLLNHEDDPGCDPIERATTGCLRRATVDTGNALTTVAGLTLVTFGVVLMGLGAWGSLGEKDEPAAPGLALVPANPAPTAAPGQTPPSPLAASSAVASSAAASAPVVSSQPALASPPGPRAEAQQQKLAAHIQLAAHANRCDAAVYLLGRLRALDEARALSLVQSDADVARCTQAKHSSLSG